MDSETDKKYKAGKVYFAPAGSPTDTAEWKELGTATVCEPTCPLAVDLEELWTSIFPGTTKTLTYTFKMSKLEKRAFMRLFGVKVPSLIHNGKKRRK